MELPLKTERSDQWFNENHKKILSRTAFLANLKQGVVHNRSRSMHQLRVERRGDQLQLYFYGDDSGEVMSRMNINEPLDLVSPYTQAMMLALAWEPNPKRLYMLGLGAGRVPMIMHSYFPDLVVECTELDADVVSVAETYFGVAFDSRFMVAVEDGRKYLEKKQLAGGYDIMCVDAFRGTGNSPFPLATKEFYALCKRRLSAEGVISVNLLTKDTLYSDKVSTIAASFRNVYLVEPGWGTAVIFATDGDGAPVTGLIARAEAVFKTYGFLFPFVDHARKLRQIAENGKLIDRFYQGHILSDNQPPAALPLPASAHHNIGNVGRNDPCPCGSGKKFKKCHHLSI